MSQHDEAQEEGPQRLVLQGVIDECRRLSDELAQQYGPGTWVLQFGAPSAVFHSLLQMRAVGRTSPDYHTLAAVSGACALTPYSPTDLGGILAFALVDSEKRMGEATGCLWESVYVTGLEGTWNSMVADIESGRPPRLWERGGAFLFAGRHSDPRTSDYDEVLALYAGRPEECDEWEDMDFLYEWIMGPSRTDSTSYLRCTADGAPRPAIEVAAEVIGCLVKWSKRPPDKLVRELGSIEFGLRAIATAARDCAGGVLAPSPVGYAMLASSWCLRASTAAYLDRVADEALFPSELSTHLRAAAELYREGFAKWPQFQHLVDEHSEIHGPEYDGETDDDYPDEFDDDWDDDGGLEDDEVADLADTEEYPAESAVPDDPDGRLAEEKDAGYDLIGRPVWSAKRCADGAALIRQWHDLEAAAIEELRKVWLALD